MLDIRFIRENAELVAAKAEQKGYQVDIAQLLGFDDKRRQLQDKVDSLRQERNVLTEKAKGQKPSAAQVGVGKKLKTQLADLEHQLVSIEAEFLELLKQVPNLAADDVPVGASPNDNIVSKEWGDKPQFDFKPKTHWQIAETRGFIDKERAAKVAGSRFAYIKGDLVRLQFAMMQFGLDVLTNESTLKAIIKDAKLKVPSKPFTPVLPPAMIKTEVFEAMDRLEPRDERYQVGTAEDNLWLQGSAEHTLGPIHMSETIPAGQLPLRYVGYLTSFRREAGSYGKDTEGIIRLHQFDKLEMESFTAPEQGAQEHLFMVAIQEYLMQQLELPYRVLNKCTADIGKPNARGVDIEVWLPGQDRYLETHTADFMTDYQARRLQTKLKSAEGKTEYVHTNDATAFAQRPLIGIIENYQNDNGSVTVPKVLQPYMGGQATI
ncbi:serine--tRNA ligase [Candidatus Saccharibacteria bacterium]|nr:serine--tRNA ligase [Candidatus Saccharibacteria bacterium]